MHGVWSWFRFDRILGDTIAEGLWWTIDLLNLVVLTMVGYGFFRLLELGSRRNAVLDAFY